MKPIFGRMHTVVRLGVGCLGVLLLTGCVSEKRQEAKVDKDQVLTAETAKKALLEMDPTQIPPGVIVRLPKDEPIQVVNADEIAVGGWTCNLKEKTFHASFAFPEAFRHKHNQVSGVFERTPDGKWVAKVTDSSSGG